ncbi:MAG: DegT/DnrJ/EryC1/StrS family aminotransferase [Phycisphaerae bacterium]
MYRIGEKEVEAVRKVIESGQLFRYHKGRTAERTRRLEQALARKLGVKHALAVSSGTAALITALAGMEIGPGDEVIVPGYTFISTALAPLAVGAVPIIAEVDESLTLDPADVERKITRYTRAIVPVYMLGLPCDMRSILRVARKRGVPVVEDAAQAAGGSYRGKRFGTLGRVGILSFNHFKIITCGEGGALVTDDTDLYQRAFIYHDGGCVFFNEEARRQPSFFAGVNYRVSEIQSAVMNEQLKRLDGILNRLRRRKAAMTEELLERDGFRPARCNEPEGDCATHLPLLFDTADAAAAFVDKYRRRTPMFRPIDTDRHVYTNWEPILRKRPRHPKMNPWKWARRDIRYGKDMCPQTLDVLARTVCLQVPLEPTVREVRSTARSLD